MPQLHDSPSGLSAATVVSPVGVCKVECSAFCRGNSFKDSLFACFSPISSWAARQPKVARTGKVCKRRSETTSLVLAMGQIKLLLCTYIGNVVTKACINAREVRIIEGAPGHSQEEGFVRRTANLCTAVLS